MYKGKDWKYAYDGLNRMTDAVYDDAGGGKDRYNETVSYNANGSALTIKRNGRNDAGKYTAIDDLILWYRGNRLLKVSDKGDACTATGATDFYDGADTSVEYTYDACGARTSDANKGIAGIQYSYWGTPEIIQFTNGSQTRYVYDANGVKLKRIHITA
ncbi:MAG: RHS repeat-associated core domain-containing protein, partial [Prevotella sp.]|nr:RHS repeat-associated core domain-containing protein [Prevotella sp.]